MLLAVVTTIHHSLKKLEWLAELSKIDPIFYGNQAIFGAISSRSVDSNLVSGLHKRLEQSRHANEINIILGS